MAVTDFFAGEIATELLKQLITISRKSALCKSSAQELIHYIHDLLPTIQEIKYSGVELPPQRQRQLDLLSERLREGLDLSRKVLSSPRWNVYKNLQLARKMEKVEKAVSRFVNGPMQAHVLADVHHVRFDMAERFDRVEGSTRRLEESLGSTRLGMLMKRAEEERERWGGLDGGPVSLSAGMELGKRKVKDMVMMMEDLSSVVGIFGIGGSGKTTLAREIFRDDQVKSYFRDRVYFLTVSQSPNVEQLRSKIWEMILSGNEMNGSGALIPQWSSKHEAKVAKQMLIVLDDVWSLSVLEQLIFRVPGCKFLVVSRFKFPSSVINSTYELELLREDEAMSLFCHYAFGQNFVPLGIDKNLVKQVVDECRGLPLALKVIGASLRDQPGMFWTSAMNRLTRCQPICESHEVQLLNRMKLSIDCLPEKVRECFLDLGSFPEDKKIPLDIIINMWVELHDIDENEAFAILVELSDKNLLTLIKDSRSGDIYSTYYEISVSQHDVLRDLAIHLSNFEDIKKRKRLVMPRREQGLPKEWERNAEMPFNAQIISAHTEKMEAMDWFKMDLPKAEVLILNLSSTEYFLPPFIDNMPKLRALVLINYGTSNVVLQNLSVVSNLNNLRSLWLEKVSLLSLPDSMTTLRNLRKLSIVLSDIKVNLDDDESVKDMQLLFPRLSEITIDHCINFSKLPGSICRMQSLRSLSITNCDNFQELPKELGRLSSLQILRIYACPNLRMLPSGIGQLIRLKYLDISQSVNLGSLPEEICKCRSLEKIDMRECPMIRNLPVSVALLQSLRVVVCDEEVSLLWKDLEKIVSGLCVQVAEECFNLDFLAE